MDCEEEKKRREVGRGGRRRTMGDDALLHLDVTYGADASWTKRSLKSDDRIFVLKQYAHARPVILLAPCISVILTRGRCRCISLGSPLGSSMVPLLLGVPVIICFLPNGTSISETECGRRTAYG